MKKSPKDLQLSEEKGSQTIQENHKKLETLYFEKNKLRKFVGIFFNKSYLERKRGDARN